MAGVTSATLPSRHSARNPRPTALPFRLLRDEDAVISVSRCRNDEKLLLTEITGSPAARAGAMDAHADELVEGGTITHLSHHGTGIIRRDIVDAGRGQLAGREIVTQLAPARDPGRLHLVDAEL